MATGELVPQITRGNSETALIQSVVVRLSLRAVALQAVCTAVMQDVWASTPWRSNRA